MAEKKKFRITWTRVDVAIAEARSKEGVADLLDLGFGIFAWQHLPDLDETDIEEITEENP